MKDRKKEKSKYYEEHKEQWKKYRKPLKTKEEKEALLSVKRKWKESHPEINLWSAVKYRAKKENIPFDIEASDLKIPKYYPYLKIELTSKKGIKHADNLMSVDRIDAEKGYVKGNVEVISYKANRMKNNANTKELIIFAQNILKIYEGHIS